jgi:hydroxypyruvate reductase
MSTAHPLLHHLLEAALAAADPCSLVTAQQALDAAADVARRAGYTPLILSSSMEGEAREVALVHASIARQVLEYEQPLAAPCVILSGGETRVTLRGQGQGGRQAEFLLALAIALDALPGVHAIAVDTGGIDDSQDNAGAWLAPGTLASARKLGLDARARLVDNDGSGFFSTLGQLIVTGSTRTEVDFRALVIEADVL